MNEYIGHILSEPRVRKSLILGLLTVVAFVLATVIVKGGIVVPLALIAFPFFLGALYSIFVYPRIGIIFVMVIGFVANGLGRYVPAPFGLTLDGMLLLTLVSAIFNLSGKEWGRIRSLVFLFVCIWFLFTIFEIFNPERPTLEAWFYAVRGIAMNMVMCVALVLVVFHREKDFDLMITLWLVGGIISALYGMKQLYFGLDWAEQRWMAEVGQKTHMLFGRLRVFSFYSDAGQFGAFMGYTGVVATVMAIPKRKLFKKLFYIATALLCFWGMAISGTRGALFVPISGFFVYFILSKNFKVLTLGFLIGGYAFYILKYTFVGQGVYQIQRMRTALDPEDASLQVRLENQRKFKEYLKTRPLGGGIGSAGYWGQRFNPGTFLAETATDSHYVRIWAETGIVGLVIHLGVLLSIFGISFFRIFFMKDPLRRQKMLAIYAGGFGIIVANYGNQVVGQMPTNVFFYMCLAFLYIGPLWEKEDPEFKPETTEPKRLG